MPRLRKPKRAGAAVPAADFAVDPLLVGADRELAGMFPAGLLEACGVVPLRRYHDLGLVCARASAAGRQGLERLRKQSPLRLLEIPAIHDFGVDLCLRSLEAHDDPDPPLWVPESRRAYLTRLGDFRSPPAATLVASLVLTSPLAATRPILVCAAGGKGHALYLHGTAGLKVGVRFPARRLGEILDRLRIEFAMDGGPAGAEPWVEGRGRSERGLDDLSALLLGPLDGSAFVIEPRGRGR
jgi:hypothetical protein